MLNDDKIKPSDGNYGDRDCYVISNKLQNDTKYMTKAAPGKEGVDNHLTNTHLDIYAVIMVVQNILTTSYS